GGPNDVWYSLIEVGTSSYVTFGAGCPGSLGVPTLTPTALPRIGNTMTVNIDRLPLQVALMMVGLSNTNSGFGPLPMNLANFGMPGCSGRVSPDVTVIVAGGNPATFSLALPGNTQLLGMRFYQQALAFDPLAGNPAGAVVSDAAAARIGN